MISRWTWWRLVLASRNIATKLYFTLFDQSLLKSSWLRLVPSRYLSVFWDERRLGIRFRRARGLMGKEEGKILFLTVTFSICSEMLNAISERKRNIFVIIPWRNASSIPRINWGSFRGRREEKWGSFLGRFGDHFGGCTHLYPLTATSLQQPLSSVSKLAVVEKFHCSWKGCTKR